MIITREEMKEVLHEIFKDSKIKDFKNKTDFELEGQATFYTGFVKGYLNKEW